MRTTLNLDDDILDVVRERARRERRSVGEVLSDLARQALTGRDAPAPTQGEFHGFRPLPHRGRLVSNDLIDALREDEPERRGPCWTSTSCSRSSTPTTSTTCAPAGGWRPRSTTAGRRAITQNGFVRIVSRPRYPNPVSPAQALDLLGHACATSHHEFWPCAVSVLDPAVVVRDRVHGPRQVTDAYLLALAVAHGGRFATFDRAVVRSAVPGATAEHLVVL